MKGLKQLLKAVFALCLAIGALALTVSLTKKLRGEEEEKTPQDTYSVSYLAVEDGEVVRMYDSLYMKGGNYPTTYTNGERLYVDDLNEIIFVGATEDRTFLGWYIDPECETPFECGGTYSENLTLYAKLNVGYWTQNY